jgi:molybdenum cofactor cytidylyltransferase
MGKMKLLLPLKSTSVLDQTISNALNSKLDEIIVVLGCKAEDFLKKINLKKVKFAINPDYENGISSSIKSGLAAISSKSDAVMILPGDQPFISSYMINKVIAKFKEGKKGIILPSFNKLRGHPVIFSLKYREEFMKLRGDTGGRGIINKFPEDVLEITVHSKNINIDIDTPEEYHQYY